MSVVKQQMSRIGKMLLAVVLVITLMPVISVSAYADEPDNSSTEFDTPISDAVQVETSNEETTKNGEQTMNGDSANEVAPQNVGDATYNTTPIEGIKDAPGFKWVEATADMPAHYRIYNPVGEQWAESHEACSGWWYFALYSRTYDFDGYLIQLDDDIDFSKYEWNRDQEAGRTQLAVGSSDKPFKGTFDGKNHTFKNLDNEREGLLAVSDCGFFGATKEAVIKNINFDNCYVGASGRSGVVVGSAQDTLLLNILCTNCTSSVIPSNNIINLITNAGLTAGMIAGETNGSTLYNCEMRAGRVVCNATMGVGALGGQTLYMGGLVGFANDTVIEYSRVSDILNEDGSRTYAEVKNQYESAVNVANYSELFTGGIVGGMQAEDSGSKVIDCYCTADVYSWSKVDFAVSGLLGAQRGYTGGIAGIVRDTVDNSSSLNQIQRVSYAGNLHSYNYNIALLGIPVIEKDKYLGAITGRGGENSTIDQAYFNRSSSSTSENIFAYKTSYSGGEADGQNFGPRDEQYTDRNFWEGCDFDFAGGMLREGEYPFTSAVADSDWTSSHYNKWVMDYKRGIPVHGSSIKATLDFPGSGTTTIGATGLADEDDQQSTTDPYDFAVQGFLANEESIDISFTLTANAPAESSWAADNKNEGYRFMGWYASQQAQVNDIDPIHSKFTQPDEDLKTQDTGLIAEDSKYQIGTKDNYQEPDYKLTVNKPDTDESSEPTDYADNNLYVAYVQAQVLLHDKSGAVINKDGTTTNAGDTDDDWYDYEGTITLPSKVESDKVGENATLVGWTTRPNIASGSASGYEGITSTDLQRLKDDGVFWQVGDLFVITEPSNLYPVYTDYSSNVNVIYEGNEQDNSEDLTLREGYGQAKIVNEEGHIKAVVAPFENSPLTTGKVRFLGWYENVGTEDAPNWVRVSKGEAVPTSDQGEEISLNAGESYFAFDITEAGVDLSATHTYEARFEYAVDYWAANAARAKWAEYATVWHTYKQEFQNIAGPNTEKRAFLHWSKGNPPDGDGLLGCDINDEFADQIVAPTTVVAHHARSGGPQDIYVTTDFPGLGTAQIEGDSILLNRYRLNLELGNQEKSRFIFWTLDRNSTSGALGNTFESREQTWEPDRSITGASWWAEAHLQAKVLFYSAQSASGGVEDISTYRTYKQRVFLEEEITNSYTWHYDVHSGTPTTTSTSEATPDAAEFDGYFFLGWIDKSDPRVSEGEWSYLLSDTSTVISNGSEISYTYVMADASRIEPYLVGENEICTRPMDLYPVYSSFGLETTTNIAKAEVPEGYNIPNDPALADGRIEASSDVVTVNYNKDGGTVYQGTGSVSLSYNNEHQSRVEIQPQTDAYLQGSEGEKYTLQSVTVEYNGKNETIAPDETGKYFYTVEAGTSYTFIANYTPVPAKVTYHLHGGESSEDNPSTVVYTANLNSLLPQTDKDPSWDAGENAFFVGWTEKEAAFNNYVQWSEDVSLVSGKTVVTHSMDLWPVYKIANINVNSNIDSAATEAGNSPAEFRGYTKTPDGTTLQLWAKESVIIGDETYSFEGWVTDYNSTNGNHGNSVSTSTNYRVPVDGLFSSEEVTYTAIYEKKTTYTINYYGTDDSAVYSTSTDDGSRTFVTEIEVPKDPEDPSAGNEKVTTPIDVDAFTGIAQHLAGKDNTEKQEIFRDWQLSAGDTKLRWSDFNQKTVADLVQQIGSNTIDIYPITYKMYALDADWPEGNLNDLANYTSKLNWSITSNESENGETVDQINVTFKEDYIQPELRVYVKSVEYAFDGSQEAGVEGLCVSAFGKDEDTKPALSTDETSNEGMALLKFYGRLTITKTTKDSNAAGKSFVVDIAPTYAWDIGTTDRENKSQKVVITVGDTPNDQGEYTGSVTLTLPYDEYIVSEEKGWSWRYTGSLSVSDNSGNIVQSSDGKVSVFYRGYDDQNNPIPAQAAINNSRVNDQWLDGEDHKTNILTKGYEGGE